MTHLLVIKDRSGKELARLPITAGWSFQELPLPKDDKPKPKADQAVGIGDQGKGKSKVG